MLFCWSGTTPSRTQNPQPPIILASIMSVVSLSPTTATCEESVTPVSGCVRKYAIISDPQPGFLTEWGNTWTPVLFSTSAACFRSLSQLVAPDVLDTTRSLRPGYAARSLSKWSYIVSASGSFISLFCVTVPCKGHTLPWHLDRQSSHPCLGLQP